MTVTRVVALLSVLALLASPRCFELVLVVGRQQGKTSILLVPVVDALLHRRGHGVVYSAQRGVDAERKVRTEFWPVMQRATLDGSIGFSFNNSMQDFGIKGPDQTRLRTISSAKEALRGETNIVLGIIDEARADKDHNRSALLTPTMAVVDDAKLVVASTAGDITSVLLADRLERARANVDNDASVTSLVEWGIGDTVDFDPGDPDVWRAVLPAIGYTVSVGAIRRSYETMEPHDFAMEFLGKWLSLPTDVAVPADIWERINNAQTAPGGELVLAADTPPEQDRAAAVVCDRRGRVELVDVRPASTGAYDWLASLVARHPDIVTVALPKVPALRRAGERLSMRGTRVEWYDTARIQQAAARMWEAMHSATPPIAVRRDSRLDAANRGAFRWATPTGWMFRRQTPADFVSPLIAASLAYDAAVRPGEATAVSEIESYDAIWNAVLAEA